MRIRISSHSLAHAYPRHKLLSSSAHRGSCCGAADELIGSYALPLPNLTKPENLVWDAEPAWYDISETSAEGGESKAGRVRLSLHWGPPAPEWGLRVVVCCLNDGHRLGLALHLNAAMLASISVRLSQPSAATRYR